MRQAHAARRWAINREVTWHATRNDADKIKKIRAHWRDTFEKNLAVAQLLCDLNPSKKYWNTYRLPFTYSWAKRLMKIASDARIASNRAIMPGARVVLHKISLLTDAEFQAATTPNPHLGLAIIHPTVTREDIEAWLRYRRGAPEKAQLSIHFEIAPGRYPLWKSRTT